MEKSEKKNISLRQGLKEKQNKIMNFEASWSGQKKLFTLINLWKLSILNLLIIFISLVLIFNIMIFHITLGDIYLLIALVCLIFIMIVNFVFIIFPVTFSTVLSRKGKESKNNIKITKESPPSISQEKKVPAKPVLPQIELEPLKAPVKKKETVKDKKSGEEYLSEEDKMLDIPTIPIAPKKKEKITVNSPGLSTEILNKIKDIESEEVKVVLVNCERCKGTIPIPVTKKAVLESELPVVPISYVHTHDKDQHCITIYVDHDFDIRRQRISDVVLS